MIASISDTLVNTPGSCVPLVDASFATIDLLTFEQLLKVHRLPASESSYGQVTNSVEGYKNIEIALEPLVDVTSLKLFLEKDSPVIVRAKGILTLDTGNRIVQYSSSGCRCEAYDGSATNRMVMIFDTNTSWYEELTYELIRLDGCRVPL